MTDPITAYLANGGTITKCPPGYAAYGFTGQCSVTAAPSDVCRPEPTRAYVQRVRQTPAKPATVIKAKPKPPVKSKPKTKVVRKAKPVAPPKPAKDLAPRNAKVLAMLNEPGALVKDVAQAFDMDPRQVRRIARAAGVEDRRRNNGRVTPEDTRRAIAAERAATGKSFQVLAKQFGVAWCTVERAVKKFGGKK